MEQSTATFPSLSELQQKHCHNTSSCAWLQSPWIIDGQRKGVSSVEERIADAVLPAFQADRHKFMSAGMQPSALRQCKHDPPILCLPARCQVPLSVIFHLSSVICHLSSVICYLLSVICYLLSVICYLLSVICRLQSGSDVRERLYNNRLVATFAAFQKIILCMSLRCDVLCCSMHWGPGHATCIQTTLTSIWHAWTKERIFQH